MHGPGHQGGIYLAGEHTGAGELYRRQENLGCGTVYAGRWSLGSIDLNIESEG